jgi:hypothetical protein
VAKQPFTVPCGANGQIVNEGFDLLSAGISQSGGPAVVSGIGLHEASIEMVLANQEAEAVAEARLAVLVAVISVRGNHALIEGARVVGSRGPAKFLDRAESDTVGLSESAVDGAGLSNAQLGAVDQGRDVGGIGVAVTDEATGARRLVNGRLKDPASGARVGDFLLKSSANSKAPPPQGDLKESSVCHIPLALDVENFPFQNAKVQYSGQRTQSLKVPLAQTRIKPLD